MIISDAWRGKRYAVLGLARSGAATVQALLASGAKVVAWDSNGATRSALSSRHAEFVSASIADTRAVARDPEWTLKQVQGDASLEFRDVLDTDLTGFAGVVVSPGVPLNRHPVAAHAANYGVPVIGDIELFAQARPGLPPHKVVGITGTNGKSTTTALIHHILKTAGVPTTMGGNIGLPILAQEPLPAGGVYVLELSSYQIDLTFSLDCDIAVLLNVTPDHLDRYESFEAYAASKARLFEMQSKTSNAVIVASDEASQAIAVELFGERRFGQPAPTWPDDIADEQRHWPALQGPHNLQNAAAAFEVARDLGLRRKAILANLRTYPGLRHRTERVREIGGVVFVNDSKATNSDSAAPALAAYPAVRWILGGQAKTKDLDACAPNFAHVRSAHTIGEAGAMFADILRPHMPVDECGTLEFAVKQAAGCAQPGDTVLLSPACASFDQFRDFEDRGDRFRALVEAL